MKNNLFCDFAQSSIVVNNPETDTAMRQKSELQFSIFVPYNISRQITTVEFLITTGSSSDDMCRNSGELGTISCPHFDFISWNSRVIGTDTAFLCRKDDSPKEAEYFCFSWKDIKSSAPLGIFNISVEIMLKARLETVEKKLLYNFPLYKALALPQIRSFNASPGFSGAAGTKINLTWNISGANNGYLVPGGQNIFDNNRELISQHEVILSDKASRYHLNVSNDNYGTYAPIDLFTVLPRIEDFKIEEKGDSKYLVKWETHFAPLVKIGSDVDPAVTVPPCYNEKKEKIIRANNYISIYCYTTKNEADGKFTSEHIFANSFSRARFIIKTIIFKNHRILLLEWDARALKEGTIYITDNMTFSIPMCTDEKKGKQQWEQAYDDMPVSIAAECVEISCNENTKSKVVIKNVWNM